MFSIQSTPVDYTLHLYNKYSFSIQPLFSINLHYFTKLFKATLSVLNSIQMVDLCPVVK